jgi:Protein of unknown function (DUF3024)
VTLPESDVAAVKRYCEERVPPNLADQVRIEVVVERGALIVVEQRPPWREDFGPEWTTSTIARLRYVATKELWTLYCCDADGRWHRYPYIGATPKVEPLLAEIERDPTGIFWG